MGSNLHFLLHNFPQNLLSLVTDKMHSEVNNMHVVITFEILMMLGIDVYTIDL